MGSTPSAESHRAPPGTVIQEPTSRTNHPLRWLTLAGIMLGVVLRLYQYGTRGALWIDEAGLSLNLVGRDLDGVARPFAYDQAAPYLYLIGTKLLTMVVGEGEWVLRLPSAIASCVALIVLPWLALRLHGWGAAAVGAWLCACSPVLVYFAGEFKPYGGDATIATCLLAISWVYITRDPSRRSLWGLGVTGIVATWFSLPALFVLAGIGVSLTVDLVVRRAGVRAFRPLLVIGALWLASFAAHYMLVLADAADSTGLREYWKDKGVYAPFPPRSLEDLRWYPGRFLWTFEGPGALSVRELAAALWCWGVFRLGKDRLSIACLIVAPWPIAVAASAAEAYVNEVRTLCFLAPTLFIPIACALSPLLEGERRGASPAAPHSFRGGLRSALAVCALMAIMFERPQAVYAVLTRDRSGPSIAGAVAHVRKHLKPGDSIFVEDQVEWTYLYYRRRQGLPEIAVFGDAGADDPVSEAAPAPEVLATLRDAGRVWILVPAVGAHGASHDTGTLEIREAHDSVVAQASNQGKQLDMYDGNNARAYLFMMGSGAPRPHVGTP